jgi:hypothetical protein
MHLLALVGYLVATVAFTWPLALNLTTAIPGDSFDGWQNYWNLWWMKLALVQRLVWPLHTDILYAPTGVNLYFHTLNPLNGLATLPVQLAAGLIPAYNAVVFLSWVLAGYGMFLLTRWVIGARSAATNWAAFLAGLVYTLSPFHMAHLLGHMQVMSLQWLPFYILYLLRAIRQSQDGRGWLRSALLGGLFLVFNGLSDWYFVLYLFLFTGLAIVWGWANAARRQWRTHKDREVSASNSVAATSPGSAAAGTASPQRAFGGRSLWQTLGVTLWATVRAPLVAGTIFGIVLSPWLLPMIQEARTFRFMVRPPADLYILSASLMDFFVPNRLHTLFRPGSFTWIGNQIAPISERTIAIGYVALGLALVAGVAAWRKAAFWIVAGGFFLLLALGPQWHLGDITLESVPPAVLGGQETPSFTPYALLNQLVPFMRVSRSVSRFALMVQLSAAVLGGLGLHVLIRVVSQKLSRRAQQPAGAPAAPAAGRSTGAIAGIAGGVAIILLLAEYWVAPYPLSPPDTPAYYEQLAQDGDTRAMLNLPMNYDRPGYLLYQTIHGKPLTVAYISRDDPRTLTERVPVLQHFRHLDDDIIAGDPAAVAPQVLADLGVGTVVLDRYKMPGGREREYTEELAGRIFGGHAPMYADERITVYKVEEVPANAGGSTSYLRLGARNWGPRQVDEHGAPWRALTGGPAAVEVLHAAQPVQITIRYRTEGEFAVRAGGDGSVEPIALTVTTLDGQKVLRELPPAPAGAEVTLELPAVELSSHAAARDSTTAAGPDLHTTGLRLQPATDNAAANIYVEQLRLEP